MYAVKLTGPIGVKLLKNLMDSLLNCSLINKKKWLENSLGKKKLYTKKPFVLVIICLILSPNNKESNWNERTERS